jgi:hypothetical protein
MVLSCNAIEQQSDLLKAAALRDRKSWRSHSETRSRGAICATLFTRFAIALSSLKDVPLEVNPKGNAKTPCAALSCN